MISPTTIIIIVICYYAYRSYRTTSDIVILLESLSQAPGSFPTVPLVPFDGIPDLGRFLTELRMELLTVLEFAAKAEMEAALLSVASATSTCAARTVERQIWVPVAAAVLAAIGLGLWEHARRFGRGVGAVTSVPTYTHEDREGAPDPIESYHCCCCVCTKCGPAKQELAHRTQERHVHMAPEVIGHDTADTTEDVHNEHNNATRDHYRNMWHAHEPSHRPHPNSPVHGTVVDTHAHHESHVIAGPHEASALQRIRPGHERSHGCLHHTGPHHTGLPHGCHQDSCPYQGGNHQQATHVSTGRPACDRKYAMDGAADADQLPRQQVGILSLFGASNDHKNAESKRRDDKPAATTKSAKHGKQDARRKPTFQEMFSVDE
jgi:hypothetical protein